jgi:short-subunit dehydrogenase
VNVVLLARRQRVLDDVAQRIERETGVEARPVAIDLAEPGAAAAVAGATADIEVGLLMYCAGGDPNYQPFLAHPADTARALVFRNCIVPMELCHDFGGAMATRGRGGIIVVSSMAGLVGGPNLAAYAGSKAFDMVFTESLWTELHPRGVDVLSLVLGETDTPALRRLREQRGQTVDPHAPLPGAATVDEVVADALEHLPLGPSWIVGEHLREAGKLLGSVSRNEAVAFMAEAAATTMGSDAAEHAS